MDPDPALSSPAPRLLGFSLDVLYNRSSACGSYAPGAYW